MNYRTSVKSIDSSTPSPYSFSGQPDEARFYGVAYRPTNPAHFEMAWWKDEDRTELVEKRIVTDIEYDRMKDVALVKGKILNDNFEFVPFEYNGWKFRNQLIMEKALEYRKCNFSTKHTTLHK